MKTVEAGTNLNPWPATCIRDAVTLAEVSAVQYRLSWAGPFTQLHTSSERGPGYSCVPPLPPHFLRGIPIG